MKSLLTFVGFVLAAAGNVGAFVARRYLEDHPDMSVKTSLAQFLDVTEKLPKDAQVYLFFDNYGLAIALAGLVLLAFGLIWPVSRRR